MSYFPRLRNKKVLLVSHNLSVTGAPLLLAETGVEMAKSGAEVGLTSLGPKDLQFPLSASEGLRAVEIEDSYAFAAEADVVITNTAVTKNWVRTLLSINSDAARKLIWWIHEIDLDTYAHGMDCLGLVAAALFDSECALRLWQQTGLPMPRISKAIHLAVTPSFLNEALRLQQKKVWYPAPAAIATGWRCSAREKIRTKLGVKQQDFLITLIGQYCPLKGQDLLRKTVGQILDSSPGLPLKALLVGFTDKHEKATFLKQLTASQFAALGPKRVVTRVSDPKPYFLASDALIMNTQLPGETFGRVNIEAMAFGLPVLATKSGGTSEVVVDGVTGLFHPLGPEGQTKLIENIRLLIDDRSRAKSLGEAGFKRVRTHFGAERFYKEFAEVMAQLTAGTD